MIKNYNLFLLENIKLSSSDVIDIIKSLSTDDKNSKLVNKLVNYADNNGKTILMDIVQKNKIDLVDYILKFKVDINHKDKKNQNVLFYCKNVNMFNKFYYMGADSTLINTDGNNILMVLSNKKIFNVDLYKKLIADGVDINKKDGKYFDNNIIRNSIFNQKILELLISKNVNLQDSEVQNGIIHDLLYKFKYYPKDRKMVINKFKYLFDNGMKVNDQIFTKSVSEELSWSYVGIDMVEEFI
jgi:ankyrin repeat protein